MRKEKVEAGEVFFCFIAKAYGLVSDFGNV
jgi:hypothetical protein